MIKQKNVEKSLFNSNSLLFMDWKLQIVFLSSLLARVLNSVGLLPSWVSWVSYHRAIVSSWVRKFFLWVFRRSQIFSRGNFVGPNFFLVGISWVSNFFSWVFRRSKFFLVGISCVQDFFLWVFCGSKIIWFSINFSKKQEEINYWGILTENFK